MTKVKVTAEYEGHPVITGNYKLFGYNERHLKNNLEMMESAVKRHNKVFSWRMDIRMPEDEDKAKIKKTPKKFINDFMNVYSNKLARKGLDPDYVVKMEQVTSGNPHFHAQIIVDGNKAKDHKELALMGQKLIEEQLKMEEGAAAGLVQYVVPKKKQDQDTKDTNQEQDAKSPRKRASHMIRRGSPHFWEQFDACFLQMSYLAKRDPKDIIPSDTRKVFYSRYNRKKCRRSD
jgi:hypothetical protein